MKIEKELLRDHFVKDFHKLGRVHDILDGWEDRLTRDVESHFSGKGYEIYRSYREYMRNGRGSVAVDLMGLWLKVPRDIAGKIMLLGEVPDLHKII